MHRWFHLLTTIRLISGKQRIVLSESVRVRVNGHRCGLIFLRIKAAVEFDFTKRIDFLFIQLFLSISRNSARTPHGIPMLPRSPRAASSVHRLEASSSLPITPLLFPAEATVRLSSGLTEVLIRPPSFLLISQVHGVCSSQVTMRSLLTTTHPTIE